MSPYTDLAAVTGDGLPPVSLASEIDWSLVFRTVRKSYPVDGRISRLCLIMSENSAIELQYKRRDSGHLKFFTRNDIEQEGQ